MKKFILILLLLTGCSSPEWPSLSWSPLAPVPPRDALNELRVLAKKNHLHYRVVCNEYASDSTYSYLAELCDKSCISGKTYIEDGAGLFALGSGKSQQEAAADVIKEYQEQGLRAFHKSPDESTKAGHRQCLPPIGDEKQVCTNCNAPQ